MTFFTKADVFADKAFGAIQAGRSYRVIPWHMGLAVKLLHVLPNALFDWTLAGSARKRRLGEP